MRDSDSRIDTSHAILTSLIPGCRRRAVSVVGVNSLRKGAPARDVAPNLALWMGFWTESSRSVVSYVASSRFLDLPTALNVGMVTFSLLS